MTYVYRDKNIDQKIANFYSGKKNSAIQISDSVFFKHLGAKVYDSSFVAKLVQRAADYPRLCGSFTLKETELSILGAAGRATRAMPTTTRRRLAAEKERERER